MEISTSADYVDKLIKALRHEEPMTRVRAAWLLGQIGDQRAVTPLLQAAQEAGDPEFLAAVVEAIGRLGDPIAVPVITQLLRTSYLKVRLAAVTALVRWHTPEAKDALRSALHDPNEIVRGEAQRALALRAEAEQR